MKTFIKDVLLSLALIGVVIFGIYFWMIIGEIIFFNAK